MRVASLLSLFIATLVLLAHVLIPHDHEKNLQSCHVVGQEFSVEWLELIAHFFHEDLGERHLEDVQPTDEQAFFAANHSESSSGIVLFTEGRTLLHKPFTGALKSPDQEEGASRAPPIA